jgi:uncharacterized protein (UPF0332 family)
MLDNKTIKESESRVKSYIKDELIKTREKAHDTDFFLVNANSSLITARLLMDVSSKEDLQKATGYLKFNGYLWVINSAYYSMFYMARALLESSGIKLKSDLSIHLLTFDALVYYFYLTGKLQKSIIETYADAKEDADELLGKEKADELIDAYYHEKKKRSQFTYEIGELAMQSKAKTSLERAIIFNKEIRKVIELSIG